MRSIVSLVLFAAALAASAWAVAALLPASDPPLVSARMAELSPERDRYDTLFFGTSRVFRGVDPVAFDEESARLGRPTRSFNLGFPAMRAHEMNALLRRVLATPPASLRRVVLELEEWTPAMIEAMPDERFVNAGRYSQRALAWHDTRETLSVLRSTWAVEGSLQERFRLTLLHLSHWGGRSLQVGRAALALRAWIAPAPAKGDPRSVSRRGYAPYVEHEYDEGFSGQFRERFVAGMDLYRLAISRLAATNREPSTIDTYNLEALQSQIETVHDAGVEAIFLLPPRGDATPVLHSVAAGGHVPAILDFSDPGVHPALFEINSRFDSQHLNPRGAELFSRAIAAGVVRLEGAR